MHFDSRRILLCVCVRCQAGKRGTHASGSVRHKTARLLLGESVREVRNTDSCVQSKPTRFKLNSADNLNVGLTWAGHAVHGLTIAGPLH